MGKEMIQQKTLLIVDDIEDFREMTRHFFRNMNCKIITAKSGKEALALIKSNAIDVVVSDVMMPEGDGFWLLEEVLKLDQKPRFCLQTGNPSITELDALEHGADAFFEKITESKKLKQWIKECLAQL